MNFIKALLIGLVLLLALFGGFMVFGLVFALVKYALFFGVLAAAGYAGWKFVNKGKQQSPQIEAARYQDALKQDSFPETDRVLAEYKRKTLTD